MKNVLVTLFLLAAICGCAQQDLKAPCANVAALAATDIPCDPRQPVNSASVPSIFAH